MTSKKCIKCKEVKPLADFYKHVSSSDGFMCRCKGCVKIYSAAYRLKNKKKINSLNKKYREENKDKIRDCQKKYSKTDACRKSNNKATKKYAENNKIKKIAHGELNKAVGRGDIIRPPLCEGCGIKGKIHAHHGDYRKPLDVKWFCISCHNEWHKKNGEGKV